MGDVRRALGWRGAGRQETAAAAVRSRQAALESRSLLRRAFCARTNVFAGSVLTPYLGDLETFRNAVFLPYLALPSLVVCRFLVALVIPFTI